MGGMKRIKEPQSVPSLFIADEVVVEIKVAPQLTKLHKAQAFSYLKVVGKHVGLLCNFGRAEPEFERLYFQPRSAQDATEAKPSARSPSSQASTWSRPAKPRS